jgi:hypothetical protein
MPEPAHIRQAILWDTQNYPSAIGPPIPGGAGSRPAEAAALLERVRQDTDAGSRTYQRYAAAGLGNGRRIVAAPIHLPHPDGRIVQIGAFLLLPAHEYRAAGDRPFCAEYIGPYLQGGKRRGAAEAGFHIAVLLR